MLISNLEEITFAENLIIKSMEKLRQFDKYLFGNQIGRVKKDQKLYEVCINHRLAVYIEYYLKCHEREYFVDIEYNKNNYLPKTLIINGNKEKVRPDIIIHTRIENNNHLDRNYMIIEIKKRYRFK